jgi:NNP family nitrate/nitrite transporter-like MFS transporter
MMNVFARALGGYLGDRWGRRWGLYGRSRLLGLILFGQGIALALFATFKDVVPAVAAFVVFGLLVCMACGATYAITPFINPNAIGAVAGIVGAGGNVGAVLAGLLFKMEAVSATQAFLILGIVVAITAPLTLALRFPALVESKPGVKHPENQVALTA